MNAYAHDRFPKFTKYELRQERDWCLSEISIARNGGHCEPNTPKEWEDIMRRRIALLDGLIRDAAMSRPPAADGPAQGKETT